jgi:glutamate dehydrogenase
VRTDIPEDPYLGTELESYFPPPLRTPIGGLIRKHRLARQIIALLVGGSMINRMGPFFVLRAEEETGAGVAQIARAYAIVRDVFDVRRLWREIEALDYHVAARVQYDSIFEISRMVRRAVYWLLQNYSQELDIEPMVMRFRPGVLKALHALPELAIGRSAQAFEKDCTRYVERGLPAPLARHIASLQTMTQILDVIELAREFRMPVNDVGKLYFALAHELKLDAIREQIESLAVDGRWRAMARATLRETLAQQQRALLRSALAACSDRDPAGALTAWLERHKSEIVRVQRTLDDMQMAGPVDFAMLSVALNEVARLV